MLMPGSAAGCGFQASGVFLLQSVLILVLEVAEGAVEELHDAVEEVAAAAVGE